LIGIDTSVYAVSLIYDDPGRGIIISVTKMGAEGAGNYHWFVDLRSGAFWPMTFDSDHEPYVCHGVRGGFGEYETRAYFGCRDGYIRAFSNNQVTDDGQPFTSTVYIGPISLGKPGMMEGIIAELNVVLATPSGSVSWSIHVGDTPEAALAADASASGTFTMGTNYRHHPRCRGSVAFLKLTASRTYWAMESCMTRIMETGRFRKP
jgi:hypothetical protein